MNRRALIEQLAPPAPPCWPDRLTWVEYLCSGAAGGKADTLQVEVVQVLVFKRGEAPAFNTDLNFCADCTAAFKGAMQSIKRCDPDAVRKWAAQQEAA